MLLASVFLFLSLFRAFQLITSRRERSDQNRRGSQQLDETALSISARVRKLFQLEMRKRNIEDMEWITRINHQLSEHLLGTVKVQSRWFRSETSQILVTTRLASADSAVVLEQYVEDGCMSITK